MIKYQTIFNVIELVRILKETEKQVVLENGSRKNKQSEFYNYHNSFNEAQYFLIKKAERKIDALQKEINRQELLIKSIEQLTPF